MSKFIELTAYGKKHLFNVEKIECVYPGNVDTKISVADTIWDVEESYETVKSLLAGEKTLSVTAEEIEKAERYKWHDAKAEKPYFFGDRARKTTCLWLKGLPNLTPTNIVDEGESFNFVDSRGNPNRYPQWMMDALKYPAEERSRIRSKTFQGIADAMADQWGVLTE